MACSERVSGTLTRVCTYDHHLAIGLPTSPLIADRLAQPFDMRIAGIARQHDMTYTRFVDDLILSGRFSLEPGRCRLPRLICRIMSECGFRISDEKTMHGRLHDDELVVTNLRFHHGRLDVAADYLLEVERQLNDHHSLSIDGPFNGPLLTRDMLRSRIAFICSIRPTRRQQLLRRFGSIQWPKAMSVARQRGFFVLTKTIRPVTSADSRRGIPEGGHSCLFRFQKGDIPAYSKPIRGNWMKSPVSSGGENNSTAQPPAGPRIIPSV
jgi:hypothetical protein